MGGYGERGRGAEAGQQTVRLPGGSLLIPVLNRGQIPSKKCMNTQRKHKEKTNSPKAMRVGRTRVEGVRGTPIEVWQINQHRARAAALSFHKEVESQKTLIALVQEPWTVGSRVCGRLPGGDLYTGGSADGRPRACVYTRGIDAWRLASYCSRDMTTIRISLDDEMQSTLIVASVYMAAEYPAPPTLLRELVIYCQSKSLPLIVGTDCNSHHTAWGSTDINDRGQSLLEFVSEHNLGWLNTGSVPTFVTAVRKEVLDITLLNNQAEGLASEWRVDTRPSFSDHRYLRFRIAKAVLNKRVYRPIRKTNWNKFLDEVGKLEPETTFDQNLPTGVEMEEEAVKLEETMNRALQAACPERTVEARTNVTWWTPKLEKLKSEKIKHLKKAQRAMTDESWERFRKARLDLKKEIRRANKMAFRNRMETIEGTHELARAVKFLQRDSSIQLNAVEMENGKLTEDPEETLRVMLSHHVPGSDPSDSPTTGIPSRGSQEARTGVTEETAEEILGPGLMERAVRQFDPFKSPGPDGVYPIMLQKVVNTPIWSRYRRLFKASLRTGYIPSKWREGRAVFIPKPGKSSYTDKKSYRMITLSSFQLKWLERLVHWHLEGSQRLQLGMHRRQFGFKAGVSCETALHYLVRRIEKAMEHQEYAVGIFLDIQNAFPTVAISSINRALERLGVNAGLRTWVSGMLCDRRITATLKGATVTRQVTRGCPQGGILSPVLWNMVMDEFLKETDMFGVYAQAYADDIAGLIVGKDPPTIVSLANGFMTRANEWGRRNGLVFSRAKTEVVVFTRLKGWNPRSSFKMDGQSLVVSKTAKYLGVTLDNKLTFKPHVEGKIQTATRLLHQAGRLVSKTWGLTPARAKWVYTSMVRPLVSYGALCWIRATDTLACEAKLRKLQRIALLQITAAYPFSPTAALEMLTGLKPLHLHLREMAVMATVRLNRRGDWLSRKTAPHKGWRKTHSDICNRIRMRIKVLQMPEDKTGLTWMSPPKFSIKIPDRGVAANRVYDEKAILCYTDGSKLRDGRAGAGGAVLEGGEATNFNAPLGTVATVFQAEVKAIHMATDHLLGEEISGRLVIFRVDNQAAIIALGSRRSTSKMVIECASALNDLSQRNQVLIEWVPGHAGVHGNELADVEAKRGAQKAPIGPEPHVPVPEAYIREQVDMFFAEEHRRAWWEEKRFRQTKEAVGWAPNSLKKRLISLERESMRHLVQLITGHSRLEGHRWRSDTTVEDPICAQCCLEVETPQHFMGDCEAFATIREEIFGSKKTTLKKELCNLNIRRIARFVKLSGRTVFSRGSD